MSTLPHDYVERVYAGVLGKIIGVYVGRPFEGWPHERILSELGEVQYYVHERLGKPLIVTDDDISGTFTFLRAMPDYGNRPDLTPAQIGQTWLNYLIEKRTVLWWGGMGNSTEHTAYLRLKSGIRAPKSGSMALNGQVVAEQIGAQIFIDGWGLICPADPQRAADLARRAASVSHDGVAVHGAQVVAAIEAQAFVEPSIARLLDVGCSVIPQTSLIYRLIQDVRAWYAQDGDWHRTFARIKAQYGYDRYGGNCHMVPNHALIILALLYGEGSFQRALTVVNSAGWDTDCNSGNVGCIMGIAGGLKGLEDGPDWRGTVCDRLYLPTADGGRAVTDALHEAYEVANIGRALDGQVPLAPKGAARYHFSLPGSVQGWLPEDSPECRGVAWVENVAGHAQDDTRSLAIHYRQLAPGRTVRILRETYPDYQHDRTHGYSMVACPALYPGQTLRARVEADEANHGAAQVGFLLKAWSGEQGLACLRAAQQALAPGQSAILDWRIECPACCTIAWVGLELTSQSRADGTVYLDWLTWEGAPSARLDGGPRALDAWVQAVSAVQTRGGLARIMQDEGTGLLVQGTREWRDYTVSARLTPHLARSFGLAARVQGLKRYYALRLEVGGVAQLVRELDGATVLTQVDYPWELYAPVDLALEVRGTRIRGSVNGARLLEATDDALDGGAIALLVEEGRLGFEQVWVKERL